MAAMILARKPRKVAVLVEREFGVGDVVARLRIAQERFRARRHPLNRPADQFRRQQHQRTFVVDGGLHAEAAADVAADDANLVVGHFQNVIATVRSETRSCAAAWCRWCSALDRLVEADAAARLHGCGGDAVDDEMMFDDVGRLGESRIGRFLVAFDLDEADVVRAIVPDERDAGVHRIAGRDDRRQWLVIDFDQLGGVDGLEISFGDDEGDVVADHAHAVLDQRRIARLVAGRIAAALKPARHRKIAEAGRLVIGAGDNREHARRGFRFAGIDLADAGMGVRRAQHIAERRSRKHHVRDVTAAPLISRGSSKRGTGWPMANSPIVSSHCRRGAGHIDPSRQKLHYS